MSDEKNVEENELNQRDLKNPKDRDALKRAADDFLKHRKNEEVSANDEEISGIFGPEDTTALEAENAELKDQVLRIAADMENLRRRTEREIADAKAYSIANFARDMLSVSDNLGRALAAIPQDARENDQAVKSLAEGVEMTERGMMAALERYGVKKIDPEGLRFDPNFHQAMFEIPDPNQPANTVAQVVQAGYIIGDRVLRPAMVGVTTGGPKGEAIAENKDSDAQG